MPRQSKPKPAGLRIDFTTDFEKGKGERSPDPQSSPINLEGIDLSSFGGDIGPDFATLPPLPQSPPAVMQPPPSPGLGHQRDPSKTFVTNFRTKEQIKVKYGRSRMTMSTDLGVVACRRYITCGRILVARQSSVWLEVRRMYTRNQVKVSEVEFHCLLKTRVPSFYARTAATGFRMVV